MKLTMNPGWMNDLTWEIVGKDKNNNIITKIICQKNVNILIKSIIEENACSGRVRIFGSFANRILEVIDRGLIGEDVFLSLTGMSEDELSAIRNTGSVEVDSVVAANCSCVINRIEVPA